MKFYINLLSQLGHKRVSCHFINILTWLMTVDIEVLFVETKINFIKEEVDFVS